jgi:peptidoglycan/LPS O-acetylase OafA/YrhL
MSRRRFDVDLVKAVGIVAVVGIHSLRPFFDPASSRVELWLGSLLVFAVPGFLCASGVLQAAGERVPAGVTQARLVRLLLPYLVASLAAQAYRAVFEAYEPSALSVLRDLLLASSFGPYYYVLHAVLFVAAAPLLARLAPRALAALGLTALVTQWAFWSLGLLPLFWAVRNPLRWLAFFVGGAALGRAGVRAEAWLVRRRAPLAALAAAGAAAGLALGTECESAAVSAALDWGKVVCTLLLLFVLGAGRETRSRLVLRLSDASYTIYLFHLFFVYLVQRFAPQAPGTFDARAVGAAWAAGLAGPLVLGALGRLALGPESRRWLGS